MRVIMREKKRLLSIYGLTSTDLIILIELNYYHKASQTILKRELGTFAYVTMTQKNGTDKLLNAGLIEVFKMPPKKGFGKTYRVYNYMITAKGRQLLQEINNYLANKMNELAFDKERFSKDPNIPPWVKKKNL